MGDFNHGIPELEGDENLVAAAQIIVQALGHKKILTDDTRRVLAELRSKLSTLDSVTLTEDTVDGIDVIEERLHFIEEKVQSWEADQSMIWDSGPEEASEYLNAADEAQKLVARLEILSLSKDDKKYKLLTRAHDILQASMARLEEEFRHLLVQNRQPFEPEHMSFRSNEEDIADENSIVSIDDDMLDETPQRESVSRNSEEFIKYLVRLDVIPDIKGIAKLMFVSKHEKECTQAFICVRKDALDECLHILEIEKLSIEDVLKMEWASLSSKIKRWVWAMKIFVRIYLASEKWLHDQIFGDLGSSVQSYCFVEASKLLILRLLNFGEAVSISPPKPEKLFGILDMYEVLADLLPDIEALYHDESGISVKTECHEVLNNLGNSVRATFLDFENAIASNPSANPFAGGGIHHLTRYVMNHIRNLADYSHTLNLLLCDDVPEDPTFPSPDNSPNLTSSSRVSPTTQHFQSLTLILESNLDCKSRLYRDASLQHFFLMNNIHYMTEKVKSSDLRPIFGDEWIKKHNGKFQQHAMRYERATWSSILSLLRDEGIQNPKSSSISRTLLKERLRSFYIAFEEVYKTQTGWLILDPQLREDLQISASMVALAYRTFVGRHQNNISEKHIKYSADEIQNFLLDLFDGSHKLLQNSHWR